MGESGIPETGLYQQLMSENNFVSGQGITIQSGVLSNRTTFIFFSSRDSLSIQFKDIFGRRVLVINAFGDDVRFWDIMNNRIHSADDLLENSMLVGALTADDLRMIFWGCPVARKSYPNIDFTYEKTGVGLLVEKVLITPDNDRKIEIQFSQRYWGDEASGRFLKIPGLIN